VSIQFTFIFIYYYSITLVIIFFLKKKKWNSFIPRQVVPFPSYPSLHTQSRLPIVFVQFAFSEHPPLFAKHSSISKIKILIFFSSFLNFWGKKNAFTRRSKNSAPTSSCTILDTYSRNWSIITGRTFSKDYFSICYCFTPLCIFFS